MGKWASRTGLYKTAFGFTVFIFLVYGLAFGTPSWIGTEKDVVTGASGRAIFQGLWLRCNGSDEIDFDDCSEQTFGDDWDWMDGVRGCWVGGTFFFLVGVIYGLIENCCGDEENRDYGLTGTFVLLAGLAGAAGVIVVTVKMEDSNIGYDEYYWGFMIACIASGLAILLAIVLLIARNAGLDYEDDDDKNRFGNSRAIDYINNYGKQPHNGGYGGHPYEYQNAGYRGDGQTGPGLYPPMHSHPPLGNGVSYHHQPNHPASHPYTVYQGNGNSLPRQNGGGGYYPGGAPGMRHSVAESADFSNGFTPTMLQAEQQTLSRTGRGDYYMNGGGRPY